MNLMDAFLEVAAMFLTPDWAALLALFPVMLLLLFVAWFLWTVRKFATLGPTRRAPARIQPLTPANVHMPGGSSSPILVAFGAAALFIGLVVGGLGLLVGTTILVLTLLVWFREAIRDYEHLEVAERLPAVVHTGPPPGVHMPGPSVLPILGALGTAALLGALVVGGWVLILAVVFLVYTLIGWLVDFTAEYRKVEEADHTGHLENITPRRLPTRTLQVFAVLFTLVGLSQLGIFPPAAPVTGGPGASPGASGAPGASAEPGGGPVAPPGALTVVAKNFQFEQTTLEAPAGEPFAVFFRNEDPPGSLHDVDVRSPDGAQVIKDQPTTDGGATAVYEYDALDAGTYPYFCSIHANMTGTLTVQ
jgi:plastocyanin